MTNERKGGISKYVWILVILLVLWGAVELFGKDKVENNIPNIATTTIVNNVATNTQVNIIGGGNEPGWYLSIQGDTASATTLLIVDYADSTFTGTLGRSWQENYDSEFQFRGILLPTATSSITEQKDFIIYFKKEKCIDDAEKEHAYLIDINMHSEKNYKGCGDLN